MPPDIARCKGPRCRRRIRWLLTATAGRRMCVDYDPISEEAALEDPRGVFYVNDDGRAVSWAEGLAGYEDIGPLYRSHWGSCVDRDKFRKAAA